MSTREPGFRRLLRLAAIAVVGVTAPVAACAVDTASQTPPSQTPTSPTQPPSTAPSPTPSPAPSSASPLSPAPVAEAPAVPVASVPDEVVHEHGFEDVGLVVVDRARPGVVLTHAPHAIFTSASLVKLLLAFEALDRGEPASDVHTMLATSHDPLASRLWVRYDGPRLVTSWAQRLDLRHTVPPERPAMWGDTLTTAADTVAVYDHLLRDAPPRTRDVVLSALQASTPRGHDGFDQRFGIPDAALRHGLSFAVKQGWACCTDHRVLHTTGVVGEGAEPDRWLVAVLTRSPRSVDYTTASANVTEFVTEVLGTAGVRHG